MLFDSDLLHLRPVYSTPLLLKVNQKMVPESFALKFKNLFKIFFFFFTKKQCSKLTTFEVLSVLVISRYKTVWFHPKKHTILVENEIRISVKRIKKNNMKHFIIFLVKIVWNWNRNSFIFNVVNFFGVDHFGR